MPGDGFTLAVGVGREIYPIAFCGGGLEGFYEFLLTGHRLVFRFKFPVKGNRHFLFWQVAYMTYRRHYFIIAAKIFFYAFCLGRRLHNDQIRHLLKTSFRERYVYLI